MKNFIAIDEVSRNIPDDIRLKHGDSALFIAYGCVLLEKISEKSYSYSAENLSTGRSALLCRRKNQLTTSGVAKMAEKIRLSTVAGKGAVEVDMMPTENMLRDSLETILQHIFHNILPKHGYGVREKQVELAEHILDTIGKRAVSLAEAEVGTGKTHAYLIAAALAKRGRINDFWIRGCYPGMSYTAGSSMPVVISTSSIALQNAIVKDYIPEISRILMEHGAIKTPLSCVIRKGKEHHVCEKNLRNYLLDADERTQAILAPLCGDTAPIDLGGVEGLTPYMKRRVGVTGRCDRDCKYYEDCRYLRHMQKAQSGEYDFQVCNHNYFLADVLRRTKGERPLISNYQAIVIDEGHKFLGAARDMYGVEFSSLTVPEITGDILNFTFEEGTNAKAIGELAIKLYGQSKRLFMLLEERIRHGEDDEETERFSIALDDKTSQYFRNMRDISGKLMLSLYDKPVIDRYVGRCSQILWELERLQERVVVFEQHSSLVYWLEKPTNTTEPELGNELLLCGIPKSLSDMLYRDLWQSGIPTILTSGTLSAGGSFEHIKRITGLQRLKPGRMLETSKPSPFNHYDNSLLYISESVPFPNSKDDSYILAVADETERLIKASHGHAAVLFTSYRAMDMVFDILSKRGLGFPLFRLDRGGAHAIDKFRKSKNGILFASGAMWEGIDLPGDVLSMLIIVKLPFAVPDPVSEYERTLYKDMTEYKNTVVVPEMIIKLKQGFGRLIRTESDTGVVALLDSRLQEDGPYRERVLRALPSCRVTADISQVKKFLKNKKPTSYFK